MGGPTKPKPKKSIVHDPKYKVGYDQGREDERKRALSYLEQRYMHPSVARGSEEGQALLKITKELAAHLRGE